MIDRSFVKALAVGLIALSGSFAGCGGVEPPGDPDGGVVEVDSAEVDSTPDVDAAPEVDAAPPAPYISDVLDCGTPASAGGLTAGPELQRFHLDTTVFPGALCNDGSAGFFYFRPATTAAAANRWVIQLQGGGACGTPDECARRWCSVDTNFGMTQMTNRESPSIAIDGDGILQQGGAFGEPNPLGDFNHVFVRYCSSDSWAGTTGPIEVDAVHPITLAPVRFRIAFGGAHIVDAVLATLRRDGASPPTYILGGANTQLPDLDDATTVIFAGASAGGAGITHNADRVADLLRANNPGLAQYLAIIDSNFVPDQTQLDYTTTDMCASFGLCTYEDVMTVNSGALSGRRGDASCDTWHAANAPDTAWQCNDLGHVQRHHLGSPFMVRMGLTDELISGNWVETGFSVPGRGAMTVSLFAELVRADLLALPTSTPEEPFARAPGIFGPPCAKHETLSSNAAVFDTTLAGSTMIDVIAQLAAGGAPALVWNPGDPPDCPQ